MKSMIKLQVIDNSVICKHQIKFVKMSSRFEAENKIQVTRNYDQHNFNNLNLELVNKSLHKCTISIKSK